MTAAAPRRDAGSPARSGETAADGERGVAPCEPAAAASRAAPRVRSRVSIARSSLVHDWKRYLAAVLAVAFSGLLVLVQLGLLLGMVASFTAVVDQAGADLWVVEGRTESFDLAREMPRRYEMRVRTHPDVASVQPLAFAWTDWRRPDGGRVTIYLIGIDVGPASLSLPRSFDPRLRSALEPAGSAVVDAGDLAKLGVAVGDVAEIGGHRVRVAGVTHGMRAIGGAYVFVSRATAATLLGELSSNDRSAYFLVRLRDPSRAPEVQRALQPAGDPPPYQVLLPEELSTLSQLYWILESGAGAGFLFSTLLGLAVGVAITSETLRGAILAALREYATLRALGVPLRALRAVVLEQALWVGIAGLAVTAALTVGVVVVAAWANVAISLPLWALGATAALTLVVALASGALALAPLRRTEPAELLR